jgi:glycosyltransferase involved in cell wall biosynthesis
MKPLRVLCVCGGFGFPIGTASSQRILLMGKALVENGVLFHVLHVGPSACPSNTDAQGNREGVTWEYLSPTVNRPSGRWVRALFFLWGAVLLPFWLFHLRKDSFAYIYYQGCLLDWWSLLICRVLRIPVAQECCEWWPGTDTPSDNRFTRWMYEKIMFRWSKGALPISQLIEDRICKLSRHGYPQLRVPVLIDVQEVHREVGQLPVTLGTDQVYFFWCGMIDGYMRDPAFIIEAFGLLATAGQRPRLVLSGPYSSRSREALDNVAKKVGVNPDQLILTGFVTDVELNRLATHARGLILPMWEDDRSKTRFPTKLGLYTAAGRPIISCAIGEIPKFLKDNVNALFFPPGDVMALSVRLHQLLIDPELSNKLGGSVQKDVAPQFDYRTHGPRLAAWCQSIEQKI